MREPIDIETLANEVADSNFSDDRLNVRLKMLVSGLAVDPSRSLLLEDLAEHGGLPKFVVREFEEYLRCGLLSAGCLHLVCRSCGHSQLVALSCKRRGFCPSCLGRRMVDTAVHMEQHVLPPYPCVTGFAPCPGACARC